MSRLKLGSISGTSDNKILFKQNKPMSLQLSNYLQLNLPGCEVVTVSQITSSEIKSPKCMMTIFRSAEIRNSAGPRHICSISRSSCDSILSSSSQLTIIVAIAEIYSQMYQHCCLTSVQLPKQSRQLLIIFILSVCVFILFCENNCLCSSSPCSPLTIQTHKCKVIPVAGAINLYGPVITSVFQ